MNVFSLYNNNFLNTNRSYLNELASVNKLASKAEKPSEEVETSNFSDYISREMEKLNNQQIKADDLTEAFIRGEVEDIHSVIVATEEARLSLELAVQIRNRCIEAYKELNNMQL